MPLYSPSSTSGRVGTVAVKLSGCPSSNSFSSTEACSYGSMPVCWSASRQAFWTTWSSAASRTASTSIQRSASLRGALPLRKPGTVVRLAKRSKTVSTVREISSGGTWMLRATLHGSSRWTSTCMLRAPFRPEIEQRPARHREARMGTRRMLMAAACVSPDRETEAGDGTRTRDLLHGKQKLYH